ncbi:hypothetical protein D3C75_694910 [compost metagenome]
MARADRLGQEVIAAFAHGVELLVQIVLGRQVDDRHADVAVIVANHLGQLGTGAVGHVHVEDDQVGLEVGKLGHGADRVGQAAGEHAGAGQYTLGVHGLCARIVDDQHAQRVVRGGVGQQFDLFQQAGGFQAAGEKVLTAGAYCGKAGRGVGFVMAEEQQRNGACQALLHLSGQQQAQAGAGEVDIHDDGRRRVLADRGEKRCGAGQRLHHQTKEFQLLGQALGALVVLQQDVHRLAHGQQQLVERVVLAPQAATRQLLGGALRARLDCLAHVLATCRLGCAGAMMALC